MSTLIVYATRHGCAEKAVEILKDNLEGDVSAVNLKENKNPDLSSFDTVIVGGSIHAGQTQRKIKKFYRENLTLLKQKRLGLFLCCMEEGKKAQAQFDEAFPAELREHSAAAGLFGGEFNFDMMNFFERAIVKKIAGVTDSVSKLKEDQIHQFAAAINKTK